MQSSTASSKRRPANGQSSRDSKQPKLSQAIIGVEEFALFIVEDFLSQRSAKLVITKLRAAVVGFTHLTYGPRESSDKLIERLVADCERASSKGLKSIVIGSKDESRRHLQRTHAAYRIVDFQWVLKAVQDKQVSPIDAWIVNEQQLPSASVGVDVAEVKNEPSSSPAKAILSLRFPYEPVHNKKLVAAFREMQKYYYNDVRRESTCSLAASLLGICPVEFSSGEEFDAYYQSNQHTQFPFLGASSVEKIKQFLDTGRIDKLVELTNQKDRMECIAAIHSMRSF